MTHTAAQPFHDAQPLLELRLEVTQRLVDPGRFGLDDQLGVVAIELQILALVGQCSAARQQPARERHVHDSEYHEGNSDGRDREDAETLVAAGFHQIVREQEGRGAEQRQRRAEGSSQ
jgi:hypothetical protein